MVPGHGGRRRRSDFCELKTSGGGWRSAGGGWRYGDVIDYTTELVLAGPGTATETTSSTA